MYPDGSVAMAATMQDVTITPSIKFETIPKTQLMLFYGGIDGTAHWQLIGLEH